MASASSSPSSRPSAYLVIRQGGRWTDVLRLKPGRRVIIGRASTSQIVIHSERCSRQHAEIFPIEDAHAWVVRDLGSRNGTLVDGRRIEEDVPLAEGQTIDVAGCQMTFVHKVAEAFHDGRGPVQPRSPVTPDQQTSEGVGATITHRRDHSSYLQPRGEPRPAAGPRALLGVGEAGEAERVLFQLAFEMARCDSVEAVAQAALQGIANHLGVGSGAVLLDQKTHAGPAEANRLTVLATHQQGERSYHRLPDMLADSVLRGNEAVLARNLQEDSTLATPDSRGELSTSSTICTPIRSKSGPVGVLHLYADGKQRDLGPEDLEFVVAAGESLSLALGHVRRQEQLDTSLRQTRRAVDRLKQQLAEPKQIVGSSAALLQVRESIQRAAPVDATVLVRGESGTGKELVAAAIHHNSPRSEGPFVCMNCAALSPSLLESELFGHEKGAFTGATERKMGKFEAADGGTLMLDEIGEMSPEIQAKFLRVLEGHPFERVGGNQPIKADVRVVAATNRDLEQAVRENQFRADLYFRLHVLEIRLPPLRERPDDIRVLAEFFLNRFADSMGRKLEGFTPAASERLRQYRWPGNVRELKNVIERAVVLSNRSRIDAEDLVLSNLQPQQHDDAGATASEPAELSSLVELEKRHIVRVLQATGGNKSRASGILGIERSTLDRKIRKYELEPAQWAGAK